MLRVLRLSLIFLYITFVILRDTYGAVIPLTTQLETMGIYPSHPNEILPIQPLLIYPKPRKLSYEGRNLDKDDDDIIYVKLLKRKSYHPKHFNDEDIPPGKELTMKDIFYVKALANGQFSHRRLKVYRLPEFFAISVYHKGEGIKGI